MSNKTKLIIGLLFLVQIGIFGWSYWEDLQEEEAFRALFVEYLDNPDSVYSMNLSGWEIDRLLDDMEQFTNLEYLNLSDNLFEEIPEEVFDLPNLKYLDLSYNLLKRVEKIENISNVDLSHNEINFIQTVTNVDSLILANNQIEDFVHLTIKERLMHLDISNNKLSQFDKLLKLKYNCLSIDVSDNTFSELRKSMYTNAISSNGSFLKSMVDSNSIIKSLTMRNCKLTHVNYISEPNYQLEYLDLSNNEFKVIDHFHQCKNLKYLNLSSSSFRETLEIYNDSLQTLNIFDIVLYDDLQLNLPNLETLSVFNSNAVTSNIETINLPKIKTINYSALRPESSDELKVIFPNTEIQAY